MTVTVSGMTIAGKTRALPKVHFALTEPVFGEHMNRMTGDIDVPQPMVQAVNHDVAASIRQKAVKAATAAKLKAVDGILWGQKPAKAPGKQHK